MSPWLTLQKQSTAVSDRDAPFRYETARSARRQANQGDRRGTRLEM